MDAATALPRFQADCRELRRSYRYRTGLIMRKYATAPF